jgi:uncharacterized protein (TIGR03437 family)
MSNFRFPVKAVTVLAITYLSFGLANAQSLPASYLGSWTARVSQTPDIGDYHTVMRLVSDPVSNIDYTDLACGGTLTLVSVASNQVVMREKITYGGCIDGGLVTIKPQGSALDWVWTHQTLTQYRAWGTFHRGTSAQPPILPPNSIVNSASFTPGSQAATALARGSIASVFGDNFFSSLVVSNGSPLPLSLAGVQVTFNGVPAPVFFVSPRQVNVQIPMQINGSTAQVGTTNSAGRSTTQTVQLAATSPSIFTLDQSGSGQGVIVFGGTASIAAPVGVTPDSRPATAGDMLTIYANGLGPVAPTIKDGQNSCNPDGVCAFDFSNLVLRRVTTTPTIEIGGVAVPAIGISFAGLAPQFVGLYQINLTVPQGIAAGDRVPVIIRQNGVASPSVTIAIR